MSQELINYLRLSLLKGIGPVHAKKLVSYCGSAEGVFSETAAHLQKIPNIGPFLVKQIKSSKLLARAQQELAFIEKNNLQCWSYWDDNYPKDLKMVMMRQFYYTSKNALTMLKS